MTIQILGSGCPNCRNLEANAREAVKTLGIAADFEKVTDMDRIVEMGVMRTPGLAVDGKVLKSGKVFSSEEISAALSDHIG
ncbi:MAG: thioredoxin family protein [Spirochaetaceae bacterium]|nr:MAG: thioredoxin family protein [Spirochaetaceae bacterium]